MVDQALERDGNDLRCLPQILAIGSESGKLFVEALNDVYLPAYRMTGDFGGLAGHRRRRGGPWSTAPSAKGLSLSGAWFVGHSWLKVCHANVSLVWSLP